jgi:hypothetical protein
VDSVPYISGVMSVEYSQNMPFITSNICHVYLENRKTEYYNNITIYVVLLQSVTYTCRDMEGPGLSFVEYLSEEWTSSWKCCLFKINL